jgi:hypothetical protein
MISNRGKLADTVRRRWHAITSLGLVNHSTFFGDGL